MRKIMVVDDEIFVRLGIKSILDWEKHGYSVVCEASDGLEAMERIEQYRPDIVLTDLMMDKMDGFELISRCKVKYPETKFVVLSSYNDFDNVRRAMKLGAEDYIFKLTVKPEEMLAVLDETSQKLSPPKEDAHDALLRKNIAAIKTRLIRVAVQQSYLSEQELAREFVSLKLDLDFTKPCTMLYLSVDDFFARQRSGAFPELSLLKFSMENVIQELISQSFRAETFGYDAGDMIALVNLRQGEGHGELRDPISSVIACIRRYLGVGVTAAMSRPFLGIGGIKNAFAESRELLAERFWSGGERFYWEKSPRAESAAQDGAQSRGYGELEVYLKNRKYPEVREYLSRTFQLYEKTGKSAQQVRIELLEIYHRLRRFALSSQMDFDALRDANGLTMYEAVTRYDLLSSISKSLSGFLDQCEECRAGETGVFRREIAAVTQYVEENLDQELTVQAAAKIANMSESYFSHLFKSETGMSFVNYVNKVRIERAEELLRKTNKRISEVALAVGIDNPNYFSILFKKIMGRSPNESRS